ncbi:MAG: outer membrane lipoprotein-sorting protein [Armatimonadota bacterium]
MRNKIITVLLIICAFVFLSDASHAGPSFNEIYKKALSINSGMKDCQADLNIKIQAKWSFVPIPINLQGKYYYKAPDKFKVDLKKTPSFLKKYPQVFSWVLPEVKEFNTKIAGEEDTGGNACYILELIPKQPMGDLKSHNIWIDKKEFIMRKQVFLYNTEAEIIINQNYIQKDGYWVFNDIEASFAFPKINLTATSKANYTNYKFNQNLPDSLFEEKDKK